MFDDVARGILRQVSCGYHVAEWTAATENGQRVRIATRWQPLELSLVPIAADRRRNRARCTYGRDRRPTRRLRPAQIPMLKFGACAPWAAPIPSRSSSSAAPSNTPAAAALAALVQRAGPETRPVSVVIDHDDPAERAAAYGEAVYARINPAHVPADRARQYAGMSLREMAADALRHAGARVASLRAGYPDRPALHTTSDFPLILADVVGKTLRNAYQVPPSGVRSLARQVCVPDFRAKTYVAFGDHLALEQVNEHGEFHSGTIGEAAGESVRVATYGKIFGYTRQMMVNDDLGALAADRRHRRDLGAAARGRPVRRPA